MNDDAVVPIRRRLPVWAVVERSYRYVWEHQALFALPVLALFIATLGISFVAQTAMDGGTTPPSVTDPSVFGGAFLALGADLALIILSIAFVVGVHRTVLLDEIRGGTGFFRWDENLRRYLWTLVLLVFAPVPAILGAGIGVAVVAAILGVLLIKSDAGMGAYGIYFIAMMAISLFATIFISLRLSLALPAAALGDAKRLTLSWQATKGNTARLFAVSFLTWMPFFILSMVVAVPEMGDMIAAILAGRAPAPPQPGIIALAFSAALQAVSIPILTTMLSLCYDVLVRGGGPVSSQPQ